MAGAQLLSAQAQPAGVRLGFRTTSTSVELTAHRTYLAFKDVAPRADCHFDVVVDGRLVRQVETSGGTLMTIDPATGGVDITEGPAQTVRVDGLDDGDKVVEIWLPHYERIELAGLRADGPVEAIPAATQRRWVHYGSSISQGSSATTPTGTWVGRVARGAGLDVTNLGFSGSAMLDGFVAEVIRDRPADLIRLEVGINLVNAGEVTVVEFPALLDGFLETIREGHPTTPLLVVSSIHCAIHEDTPGPAATDFDSGEIRYRATGTPEDVRAGKLTLRSVREEIARVVERRRAEDGNIHYLDGLELFGADDAAANPLTDRFHPNGEAHALIAERFLELARPEAMVVR